MDGAPFGQRGADNQLGAFRGAVEVGGVDIFGEKAQAAAQSRFDPILGFLLVEVAADGGVVGANPKGGVAFGVVAVLDLGREQLDGESEAQNGHHDIDPPQASAAQRKLAIASVFLRIERTVLYLHIGW